MRIGLAGAGAFGTQHIAALSAIPEANLVTIAEPNQILRGDLSNAYPGMSLCAEFEELVTDESIDAVILTTPTPMHADQAIAAMKAGKHVLVEIPLADSLADAERVLAVQQATGRICMVGHTRRFNPSHQWVKNRIDEGTLSIQAMVAETFFFRRENINAKGEPRYWTDHLLWHHAAHSIDLFQYMTGSKVIDANVLQGPLHAELGIAMDMSIQLRTQSDQVLTLSLSFNNDGPLGTRFRYIGDTGTYLAHYD
ncbi:MAG: Gfo/Idh/MocA family oxidoreductase, partial [Altererythrobacter sp.]|nr:Gfo/Idh/MocA family oxidoreductase [Altererythrobacter sp.]